MALRLVVSGTARENDRIGAEAAERSRIDEAIAKTDAQQKLHDLVIAINKLLQGNRRNGTVSITLHVDSYDKDSRPLAKKSIPAHAVFH